jgi:putative serine/threonine protein kinase
MRMRTLGIMKGEDFIVYEFIDGVPFEKAKLSRRERLAVYIQVLELIKVMDELGINKEELQCLDKNLMLADGKKVVLIDFERGSLCPKKKHNLSQFLQLLVKEGVMDKDKAVELGKRYTAGEEKVYEETRAILERAIQEAS